MPEEVFFVSGHEFIGIGKEGKHSPDCKLCAELTEVKVRHAKEGCELCHWDIPGHNPETCDLCRS